VSHGELIVDGVEGLVVMMLLRSVRVVFFFLFVGFRAFSQ